jgi:hypothetical protein
MNLKRIHHGPEYCVGELYLDGVRQCFTLEDAQREIVTRPVAEWKIQNRTAIPKGTYRVVITHSNRFNRQLPLLLGVPGYTGIRIHAGNTSKDTEGCILVGNTWGKTDFIGNSRSAMANLMVKLRDYLAAGKILTIKIE